MKLKYNILHEENASLKSQVDTMHKQSKESRKIIEKHRELKAAKQNDAAVQTDLVSGKLIVCRAVEKYTIWREYFKVFCLTSKNFSLQF